MTDASLVVEPVVSAADLDAFIHLPWDIYQNDPLWVPPLIDMAGLTGQPVRTFSIGFAEQAYNETPKARAVSQRFGTQHTEFTVDFEAARAVMHNEPLVQRYKEKILADLVKVVGAPGRVMPPCPASTVAAGTEAAETNA